MMAQSLTPAFKASLTTGKKIQHGRFCLGNRYTTLVLLHLSGILDLRKHRLVLFLLLLEFFWCHLSLAAEVPTSPVIHRSIYFDHEQKELTEVDRKILLELIKLSRFNIRFRLEANYHWGGRALLYPLAQECGTGAIFANNVLDLSQRARALNNPKLISKPSRKRGLESAIVGSAVNGTSSAMELAQNSYVAWHARQLGFSPKLSVAFVKNSLNTIDELLKERDKILGSQTTSDAPSIAELEGRLLKHVRNQLLFEFKTWSVASRETEWRENTFYFIDTGRNYTSMSGYILGLEAFTNKHLRGNSAITSLVGNSLATVNPLIRDLAAFLMRKHQEGVLDKIFPQNRPKTIEELRQHWNDLDQLIASKRSDTSDKQLVSEIGFLISSSRDLDNSLSREEARIRRLRRVAAQQEIAGPIIGLTGVARAIGNVVAYYGYPSRPVVANRINFAGQISQTTGQSYSLVATPKAAITNAIYQHRLAKDGKLPSQILRARLARLDEIEAQIQKVKP
jgi:hypothetical protein